MSLWSHRHQLATYIKKIKVKFHLNCLLSVTFKYQKCSNINTITYNNLAVDIEQE